MAINVFEGERSWQDIRWKNGDEWVVLRHWRVAEGVIDGVSYAVITPSSPGGPGLWITSPEGERISIQVLTRLAVEEENGVGTRALTCAAARKWCQAFLEPLGWRIGEDYEDPPEAA